MPSPWYSLSDWWKLTKHFAIFASIFAVRENLPHRVIPNPNLLLLCYEHQFVNTWRVKSMWIPRPCFRCQIFLRRTFESKARRLSCTSFCCAKYLFFIWLKRNSSRFRKMSVFWTVNVFFYTVLSAIFSVIPLIINKCGDLQFFRNVAISVWTKNIALFLKIYCLSKI